MSVQGDDVERHRGDVHGEPLGVGHQEAEGGAELPLLLQRVHQGEGEAQRVDQEVGCRRRTHTQLLHSAFQFALLAVSCPQRPPAGASVNVFGVLLKQII